MKTGAIIRAYLISVEGISNLVGTNIYASQNFPAGFDIETSSGILLGPRGGSMHYAGVIGEISMQFRCFARTESLAEDISNELFSALNFHKGNGIINAYQETPAYPLLDPDTKWKYFLTFYRVYLKV